MDIRARTGIDSVVRHLRGGYTASGSALPNARPDRETLASIPDGDIASRFCAWRGASDRRYVFSVYQIDGDTIDAGLPAFEGFVLTSVARGPIGRRILAVSAVERVGDRKAAVALGLALGAQEWHAHFLAEDRRERLAMVADLHERHGDAPEVRCA